MYVFAHILSTNLECRNNSKYIGKVLFFLEAYYKTAHISNVAGSLVTAIEIGEC